MNKEALHTLFKAGLAAADPYRAVRRAIVREGHLLSAGGQEYDLARYESILLVGAGKAAAGMARAVEDTLGERIRTGCIIVPYGQTGSNSRIDQRFASHPLPDTAGVEATQKILELVRAATENVLVICLLSGGGSALLVQPASGIALAEKQRATELLLKAGASIAELNIVRKHLSRVKGGQLAQAAWPATVLSLILSDVIGNRPDVIASGPTAPDPSSYQDALEVLGRHGVSENVPGPVKALLERGAAGREAETPKSREKCFERTRNVIVGSIETALSATAAACSGHGWSPEFLSSGIRGEAREAARFLAETARNIRERMKPGEIRCLLSGGETTVRVRGGGRGGRNQELALAFALAIEGTPGITLLSAGTDGIDGPTDAAGAVVDGATAAAARKQGINPETYLEQNDSYSFFKRIDLLAGARSQVITGATGTNVMDIQIIVVEKG